jgi:hypothetical protein
MTAPYLSGKGLLQRKYVLMRIKVTGHLMHE